MEKETGIIVLYRTPTPVKEVINYDYSNKAEDQLNSKYKRIVSAGLQREKLEPRLTQHFANRIQKQRDKKNPLTNTKPEYKMKIFRNVQSKVKEGLTKKKPNQEENIDKLISQLEQENANS